MTLPTQYGFNELPTTTIVPSPHDDEAEFIQYFNRTYEDIAFAVNNKDNISFTIPVSNGGTLIPNLPNFGAYLLCASGTITGMPSYVWALCQNNANAIGTSTEILKQVGSITPWSAATLTITSVQQQNNLYAFQINHSISSPANVIGNFSIRYITT
jgi:hypothetical protein